MSNKGKMLCVPGGKQEKGYFKESESRLPRRDTKVWLKYSSSWWSLQKRESNVDAASERALSLGS